jgi:nitrogen fixation protein NifB
MDYQEYIEYRNSCTPKVEEHPCYSKEAHHKFGRIHVPVAPECNIQCNYCVRKYACSNENRPGVTTKVVSPDVAMETIRQAVEMEPRIRVIGIAGPGDPLANDETIETLIKTKEEFPTLIRCMSTNGLALPDRIEELDRAWVTTLTITINAVDPEIGEKIYSFVKYRGKTYRGREAFEVLSRNQLEGLREAVKRGMVVKVNSVLIPGINDHHLVEVAKVVRGLGAYTMNIIPLIPQGKFRDIPPPTAEELNRARDQCEAVISQFRNCIQCRADAIGVPGEEGCSSNILEERPAIKLEIRR